jgi:hypothetical protein
LCARFRLPPTRFKRVRTSAEVASVGWTVVADQAVYKDGKPVRIVDMMETRENGRATIRFIGRVDLTD